MNFSPILFSASCSHLPAAWQGVGRAFSHVWQTIHQISSQLYQLILDIKNIVCKTFSFYFGQRPQSCVLPEKMGWQAYQSRELLEELGFVPCESKKPVKKTKEPFLSATEPDPLKLMNTVILNLPDFVLPHNFPAKDILINVSEVMKSVKKMLQETSIKKPVILQEYLELIEPGEKALDYLKTYASHFEDIPEAHHSIQITLRVLEDRTRALGKEMCCYIRRLYKPNNAIRSDGHCLFWSIQSQLKIQKGQKDLRKLAADYIRAHPQEYESAVIDAIKTPGQAREKMEECAELHGGIKPWREKLEKELGRKVKKVDFYCDTLENTTMWAGINELSALSEVLEVPFLVFTGQDSVWRLDVIRGVSKFKDCDPVLLYYNGKNHYQNLLLK